MENQNKPQAVESNHAQEVKKVDAGSHKADERKAPGHQEGEHKEENKAENKQSSDKDNLKS